KIVLERDGSTFTAEVVKGDQTSVGHCLLGRSLMHDGDGVCLQALKLKESGQRLSVKTLASWLLPGHIESDIEHKPGHATQGLLCCCCLATLIEELALPCDSQSACQMRANTRCTLKSVEKADDHPR
ncbi:hypothetical protein FOZ62_000967, partial [Perkinsus olseni]